MPTNKENQKKISTNHYHMNRERYHQRTVERRAATRSYVNEQKTVPCTDCGVSYPPFVMDFDHQGDKIDTISRMVRKGLSLKRIQAEIDKCEVVCSNCHRIRTHGFVV